MSTLAASRVIAEPKAFHRKRLGERPLVLVAIGIAGIGLLCAWLIPLTEALGEAKAAIDLIGSCAFLIAGLIVLHRRPDNRIGALMIAFALLGSGADGLRDAALPWRFTIGQALAYVVAPLLAYLALAFPSGRLRSGWDRAIVGALSLVVVGTIPFRAIWTPPGALCFDCPPAGNLFFVGMPPFDRIAAEDAFLKVRTALIALVLVTLVVHWARASRPSRRAMAPVALTAAALALNFVAGDLYVNAHYVFRPADQLTYIDIPTGILTALIPGAFLGTLLSTEVARSPVGRLMAELGRMPPEELEDPLRRALADPSLEVGYWADPPGAYVDTKGTPLSLPASGGSRAASYVTDAGMPLAVLVHDAALLEDGALIDAVSSAARLTLRNARLRAELRAQLRLVSTSRARILAASDEERRRIQADLATGVEPRLERLAELIGSLRAAAPAASAAEALVDEIDQASRDTRAELRDLAAGVHPAALSEEGLASALRMLAERAAIPVALGSLPDRRLPVPVVVAAYFVCSEAITNATKHSGASEVVIEAAVVGASLELTVTDDGAGGARLDRGSGLSGLVDRVDALGGRLELESPSGGGTRLAAVLPLSP